MSCKKCGKPQCCCKEPLNCSTYSSTVIWDGGNIPELCIRNGDSLNSIIKNLANKQNSIAKSTLTLRTEEFVGYNNVVLKYPPEYIISVNYCGFHVPSVHYVAMGRQINFKKLCGGDDSPLSITYLAQYTNDFNTPCL